MKNLAFTLTNTPKISRFMRVKCVKEEGWNKNNQNFNVASNIIYLAKIIIDLKNQNKIA